MGKKVRCIINLAAHITAISMGLMVIILPIIGISVTTEYLIRILAIGVVLLNIFEFNNVHKAKVNKINDEKSKDVLSPVDREDMLALNNHDQTVNNVISPLDRENILRLKKCGWTVKEISLAMKFSEDEVKLILENDSEG